MYEGGVEVSFGLKRSLKSHFLKVVLEDMLRLREKMERSKM
jgi:hypothetical protein